MIATNQISSYCYKANDIKKIRNNRGTGRIEPMEISKKNPQLLFAFCKSISTKTGPTGSEAGPSSVDIDPAQFRPTLDLQLRRLS